MIMVGCEFGLLLSMKEKEKKERKTRFDSLGSQTLNIALKKQNKKKNDDKKNLPARADV